MRIRMQQEITDRSSLKPAPGDHVLYEGTEYIITAVGTRWVMMYKADDPRKSPATARVTSVIKIVPGADVQA